MKRTEKEIKKLLGPKLNNTMNHLMKDKDTTSTMFPTSGLWKDEVIFKTTNSMNRPSLFLDPDLDKLHHIKMNQFKKFDEEMQKAKNMMMKKTNNNKNENENEKNDKKDEKNENDKIVVKKANKNNK